MYLSSSMILLKLPVLLTYQDSPSIIKGYSISIIKGYSISIIKGYSIFLVNTGKQITKRELDIRTS